MTVQFTKDQPTINLAKGPRVITVVLTWTSRTDVDLACLYELASGQTGCIQALGNNPGSLDVPPFVALDHDDRAGGQETMRFDVGQASQIRRLMFFAYIYQGGSWQTVGDARVVVTDPTGETYVILLEGKQARTCTLLDVQHGPRSLVLRRLEEYFRGTHEEVDRHYGWPGINWTPGRKG